MENQINTLLKEYGLKDKEATIFVFLFGKSELTAYKVAKETGLHRSTVYDVLDRLIEKGFISKVKRGNATHYQSNELSHIIAKLKDKENILEDLIPSFEKIREQPAFTVRILESVQGLKQFDFNLFDLARKKKLKYLYLLSCGPLIPDSSNLRSFIRNLINEIIKHGLNKYIDYKGLLNLSFKGSEFVEDYNKLGPNKFLENLPTKTTTVLFNSCVAFLFKIRDKSYVIKIDSKEIEEEMKAYFNHLWKIAKD